MGRYVGGDWEWKFAFGDQSSSFGMVLEEIVGNVEDDVYLHRYVGTNGEGEILELNVDGNWEGLANAIAEFIGPGFKIKSADEMEQWSKCEKKFDDNYWDKVMMWKFLKEMYPDDSKGCYDYNFTVEY